MKNFLENLCYTLGMEPLAREFYLQNACVVARQLLGARLVRRLDDRLITTTIVETEAYTGRDDAAAHSFRGRTPRNLPMWEIGGHAYTYFIYGMYWLLNVTCEPEGEPAAVLIRALESDGLPTHGPGRLTRVLQIDGRFNRADLTRPDSDLWISGGISIPDSQVRTGARVGLGKGVAEPWRSIDWRFWVADNRYVSK